MKKLFYSVTLLLCVATYANAQWSTGSGTVYVDANVGISTNTPTEKLHVVGSMRMAGSGRKIIVGTESDVSDYLLIQDISAGYPAFQWVQDGQAKFTIEGTTGNTGFGIPSPTEKVHLDGNIRLNGSSRKIVVGTPGTPSDYLLLQDYGAGGPAFQWVQDGSAKFTIEGTTGNVGIGTTTPDEKLAVRGVIHTQEVRVDLNGAMGPDYVFEKNYGLLPLQQLGTFINENKHLPDVPSAKDMEENGVYLKEMNLLLLKKVEELTLYLLEERNAIEELKSQNVQQQKEIDSLKKGK